MDIIVEAGLLRVVARKLKSKYFDVRADAAYCLNLVMTKGRPKHVHAVAEAGAIRPLIGVLSASDGATVLLALRMLETMGRMGPPPEDPLRSYSDQIREAGAGPRLEVRQLPRAQRATDRSPLTAAGAGAHHRAIGRRQQRPRTAEGGNRARPHHARGLDEGWCFGLRLL